ncbi:hypothetical protein QBC47DRAFT_389988 [Echria macrotheca]|uniref:Ubiquitin-like domain-containing protein n=1 Tax=Echria macrotheca TaxID=438768 RepID=A0AAJ0B8N4_9PEZI|nr:hypothetical protein QBC47DRAFT_389988 [Echria macrotheca]
MSFGFSVGDFLAAAKLVADITSCLKDIGGSKSEYRDLILELECLRKALIHLDELKPHQGCAHRADSIKYAALSCRRPLEEFLAKLRRYEPSLGAWAVGSSWKAPVDKVRFMISQKDEIRKMQSYLSVHVGTLNILLAEFGLETMNLARGQTQAEQVEIRDRLETTKAVLVQVRDSVVKQAAAVCSAASMLERLYKLVCGEVRTSLKTLESIVTAACVSTQQIYGVVVEIRGAVLSRPDIRWTFLQDPVLVEDALGRKFPVPSEYDFALLDRIIQHKFLEGPGSSEVSQGDYQMRDAKARHLVLSVQSRLRPGSSLIMAILIGKPPAGILTDHSCPMPRCSSGETTQAEGGGRICCSCGVWFSETEQRRKSTLGHWDASRGVEATPPAPVTVTNSGSDTRKRSPDDESHPGSRKRMKVATPEDEAKFKYISLAGSDHSAASEIPRSITRSNNRRAWTALVQLLPNGSLPMPFERNTNAYQRCLSRGLHQMIAVHGQDAESFCYAVERVFGRFFKGRPWLVLQAKLCDAEELQGLPMLRPLPPDLENKPLTFDFLRNHCAVSDNSGMIDSVYIAMKSHTISWHTLRHAPVWIEGLEDSWAFDELLDPDPFDDNLELKPEENDGVKS